MSALHDVRPGEACIRNATSRRQVVTTRLFVDARIRPYAICLEPETTYIVPASMGGREAALEIDRAMHERGVEVDERATHGAIPQVIAPEDSRAIGAWLHGPREPSHVERVADLLRDFDLALPSLAECAIRLVEEADFEEETAAAIVQEMYEAALAHQTALREPWRSQTAELIAKAKEGARA